jgi:hypothetical protein
MMAKYKVTLETMKIVCDRCETEVSFEDVSAGYYAVCLKHDEDLYQIETKVSA